MSGLLSYIRPRNSSYICQSCHLKLVQGARRHHSTESSSLPFIRTPRIAHNDDQPRLPQDPARTRFAPSPTGYLHLGSLRTALFNYLLAKRTGGQFVLRLEDTDKKRTVADAEHRLYDDLRWAGLQWDEGPQIGGPCGPYRQSERTFFYRQTANRLLETGHAYRCFCTPERLDELARSRNNLGLGIAYDRTCAHLSREESDEKAANGTPFVVRLKVPDVYPEFYDLVYGMIERKLRHPHRSSDGYEDLVLLKSDGLPTYHLANVVDDHHMHITHVIRGTEWLQATAKHLVLYNALGWEPPQFAHVSLLVNEDGQKLSKRNLDTGISHFRDSMGVFPEALANFAALLGWSHTGKSDVLTMDELTHKFHLKLTKGNTAVNLGKLWFLQGKHALRRASEAGEGLTEMVVSVMKAAEKLPGLVQRPDMMSYVKAIVLLDAKNFVTASQFVDHNRHFFTKPPVYVPIVGEERNVSAAKELQRISRWKWKLPRIKKCVSELVVNLAILPEEDKVSEDAKDSSRESARSLYSYLRKAIMQGKDGMGVTDAMYLLGREETMRRLGIEDFKSNSAEISELIADAESAIASLEADPDSELDFDGSELMEENSRETRR